MDSNAKQAVGLPPGAASGKGKLPKWARILLIILLVIGVIIVAGVVAINRMMQGNDKEVQSFLDSLYASDYATAWNHFLPELKAVQDLDTFESLMRDLVSGGLDDSCQPKWTTNTASVSTDTRNTKEVGGSLDCARVSVTASFKLAKQDDTYKLYAYSFAQR